jgi:hypothetical protein
MREAIASQSKAIRHLVENRRLLELQSKAIRHLVENRRLLEPSPAHEELGIELLWEMKVEALGAVPDSAR